MPPVATRRTLSLAGLDVPVIEINGSPGGPRLTVLAGVHGCEYAPMAAVREWTRGLERRDLSGRVVAVPVLNLPSFLARSQFVVPGDGINLNRCFPGDPAGTIAERLAHDVFTKLIEGSDAVIDAHSGDMVEALESFAMYDAGRSEDLALDLATAYGLRYVIRQEPGPDRAIGGTTSTAAAEAGIPAIIAEAGGCGLVAREAVQAHISGLDRVLALLGMTSEDARMDGVGGPGEADRRPHPTDNSPGPVHLRRILLLRCEHAGWWEPAVEPGQKVGQGRVLGTMSSIDGSQVLQTVTAPASGVTLFLITSPAVAADGLLLGLGVE
jgi:predicted deacylase